MKKEINDTIDLISMAFAIVLGVVAVALLQYKLDALLVIKRGYHATGGEMLLYLIALGIILYLLFNLFTYIGHIIKAKQDAKYVTVTLVGSSGKRYYCSITSISTKLSYDEISYTFVRDINLASKLTLKEAEMITSKAKCYCKAYGVECMVIESENSCQVLVAS